MATFNYNQNIPAGPNNPSSDQPLMQTNTNSINSIINQDHYSFGQSNKDGTHRQVTLTNLGSAPGIGVGNGVLYSFLGADGNSWPAWQNSFGVEPLTSLTVSQTKNNGRMSLPGSILVQWGFVASTTSGTVTFGTAFTSQCFNVFTNPYFTGANPNGAAGIAIKDAPSTTAFNWVFNSNSGAYAGFYWMAIGV